MHFFISASARHRTELVSRIAAPKLLKNTIPILTNRNSFATFVAINFKKYIMEDENLKLIIAQQVVILKGLEKLEQKVNGGWRLCSIQTTVNELKKEAMKIVGQITTW